MLSGSPGIECSELGGDDEAATGHRQGGGAGTGAGGLGANSGRERQQHRQLIHPSRAGKGTVAIHAGEIVPPKTLKRILEQAGMAVDELREVL